MKTNEDGRVKFENVPLDTYELEIVSNDEFQSKK